jgi:hypothetical protein
VSERGPVRSFFRIAKTYPPGDGEYLTTQDRRGPPSAGLCSEQREVWDAYSAFDSLEAAIEKVRDLGGLRGWLVVRYDIPPGAAIRWKKTFGPGHYSLWGDKEELKRCLTDIVVQVQRPAPPGSGGTR